MLFIGGESVTRLWIGDKPIQHLYIGEKLVWGDTMNQNLSVWTRGLLWSYTENWNH